MDISINTVRDLLVKAAILEDRESPFFENER